MALAVLVVVPLVLQLRALENTRHRLQGGLGEAAVVDGVAVLVHVVGEAGSGRAGIVPLPSGRHQFGGSQRIGRDLAVDVFTGLQFGDGVQASSTARGPSVSNPSSHSMASSFSKIVLGDAPPD